MTLIAAFVKNGVPVILGDLLTTREVGTDENTVSIPTVHDVNGQIRNVTKMRVVGLRQKVNIISDQICVAWAGSYSQAKDLIQYLYDRFGESEATLEEYDLALNSYPLSRLTDVCIISYFYDGHGFARRHCGTDLEMFELDGLQDVQVAGTGTSIFVSHIETMMAQPARGEANILGQAVGGAMSFATSIFGHQMFTGSGILDGWGGGFEIAVIRRGRFEKVSDQLHLYWTATEQEDGGLEIHMSAFFVKSDYHRKTLRILVCDWSEETAGDRLHIINPMFQQCDESPTTLPDLNYNWLSNHVRYTSADGQSSVFNRVDWFSSDFRPVVVEVTEDRYNISLENGFVEKMFQGLYSARQI